MTKIGRKQKKWSDVQKKEILDFLKNHTYRESGERFQVSVGTLGPWKQKYSTNSEIITKKRGRKKPDGEIIWKMKYTILKSTIEIINQPRWVKIIYIKNVGQQYPLWVMLDVLDIKRSYWDKYKDVDFEVSEKYKKLDPETRRFLEKAKPPAQNLVVYNAPPN